MNTDVLWISEATGNQSRLLEAAPAAHPPPPALPHSWAPPGPRSFQKEMRELPEDNTQKALPTS
jgi:hypothetical protein